MSDVRENWEITDEFGVATPAEVEEAIAILSMNNGPLAYKIQACFARGGAFTARVETDGDLEESAREAGWALSELIQFSPWDRRGHLATIVQKLGQALMAQPSNIGEREEEFLVCVGAGHGNSRSFEMEADAVAFYDAEMAVPSYMGGDSKRQGYVVKRTTITETIR